MKARNFSFVKKAFLQRGYTIETAVEGGLSKGTVTAHFYGYRKPSAEYAVKYEQLLNIPRSEIRPDLWPAVEKNSTIP